MPNGTYDHEKKRYFWLKLKQDFFNTKHIKKLRQIAGGDTYTIIYLKMQLKSINTGGVLTYDHIENSFAEELALDLDEDVDNVTVVLTFLKNYGLIEMGDDDTYFLPEVAENIGSVGAGAERQKRYIERKRQKELASLNDAPLTASDTDIDIEKDKDKEKELDLEVIPPTPLKSKKAKSFADPNEVFFPNDQKLDEAFREYVKMRAAIKKPLTDFAKKLELKKIMELANGDNDQAIEILNQSITHNWQGLYALKQSKSSDKPYMKDGMIDWSKV